MPGLSVKSWGSDEGMGSVGEGEYGASGWWASCVRTAVQADGTRSAEAIGVSRLLCVVAGLACNVRKGGGLEIGGEDQVRDSVHGRH